MTEPAPLPALPEPDCILADGERDFNAYTADQMHAYAQAAIAAAHAQQPAALTDAQIIELSVDCYDSSHTNPLILFARAIERAHGIPAPTTDTGMSMDYIRSVYNVPAKRGGRVEYTHPKPSRFGTIVRADGARLRIRLDGDKHAGVYHPTWELRYLPEPNTGEG